MKARDLFAEELDVVRVVQSRRFYGMAVKRLLKKDVITKLKKKSMKSALDSSSNQDDEKEDKGEDSYEKGDKRHKRATS